MAQRRISSDSQSQLRALEARVQTLSDLHVQTSLALEKVRVELRLLLAERLQSPRSVPILDRSRFVVGWARHECSLGPTILFRLMERLLRRPDHFITHEQLLNDVWSGDSRADSTVRSALRHLRRRLRQAGMQRLANCIHAAGRSCALVTASRHAR